LSYELLLGVRFLVERHESDNQENDNGKDGKSDKHGDYAVAGYHQEENEKQAN
jgi:hypothetical protein